MKEEPHRSFARAYQCKESLNKSMSVLPAQSGMILPLAEGDVSSIAIDLRLARLGHLHVLERLTKPNFDSTVWRDRWPFGTLSY